MNLPWLPETKLLLVRERHLAFLRLRRSLGGKVRIVEEREYPLGPTGDLRGAVAAMQRNHRPRLDDLLLLGLPLELFTVVHCSLPLAAAENLEEAVSYELMRHVPDDLETFYWRSYCREENDRLAVCVTLAERARVDGYKADFAAAGLNLTAVFPALFPLAWMVNEPGLYVSGGEEACEMLLFDSTEILFQAWDGSPAGERDAESFLARSLPLAENRGASIEKIFCWSTTPAVRTALVRLKPEAAPVEITSLPESFYLNWAEFPYSIDLISPEVMKRRRLWFKLEAAALAFFLVSLLSLPLAVVAGKGHYLARVETRLAETRREAEKLKDIRQRNRELIERFEALGRLAREHARTIDVLKELTEVIPQDAWLRSLAVKNRRIYLQGTSKSATTVVKALENSPLFKEVHFDSPVVKRGGSETFKIVVDLE